MIKTINDLDGFKDICEEQGFQLKAGASDWCDGSTLKQEEEEAYKQWCQEEDQRRKSGQDFAPQGGSGRGK